MPPENGQAIILNEKVGFWQGGTWWSNSSFERTAYRWSGNTTYNYGTQAKGAHNWWDVEDDEVEQWTRLTAHSKPKDGEDDEAAYLDYLEKKWQDGLNEPSPKASLVT